MNHAPESKVHVTLAVAQEAYGVNLPCLNRAGGLRPDEAQMALKGAELKAGSFGPPLG